MIDILNMGTTLATDFVLLFLGVLMARGFRRQRRPQLIINRAYSDDIGAPCLISNMSYEPIYLSSVLCAVEVDGQWLSSEVTDLAPKMQGDEEDSFSFQGPIPPKRVYQFIGFDALIRHTLTANGRKLEAWGGVDAVEIRAVAAYGNEKYPLGVQRRFSVVPHRQSAVLVPASAHTRRLSRRWHQREIQGWFRQLA